MSWVSREADKLKELWFVCFSLTPKRQNNSGDIMFFAFLFVISDLWCHLAIFFIVSKIKSNFQLIIINFNNFQ